MSRSRRLVHQAGIAALAITVLGATASVAGAHPTYPPGWNQSQSTPATIYQFVPGGNRMHVVAGAPSQTATVLTPATGGIRYQFVPGGNRLHVAP